MQNTNEIIVGLEEPRNQEAELRSMMLEAVKRDINNKQLEEARHKLGLDNEKAGRVTAQYGSTDDILPFTASKKHAKALKGLAGTNIWSMHTPEYWEKKRQETEILAQQLVDEQIANVAKSKNATVEIDNSSDIVLR